MKNKLRKKYIAKRQALDSKSLQINSQKIAEALFASQLWQESGVIMSYLAFQNEVMTLDIIKKAWLDAKRVIVPICLTENCQILASELESFSDLAENKFGILEPKKEMIKEVDPKIIDLALIPGLSFDLSGNRLGFGKGYYDRFLVNIRKDCQKIALAHDLQIAKETLPFDKFDVKMDYLCTEKGIYPLNPQTYQQKKD